MYVITGATGNTGSLIARHLIDNHKPVRVIGRSADTLLQFAKAEPFVADLSDSAALTEAFQGATAIYAMIPPNPAHSDYRSYQSRIVDALVEAIARARVTHVVTLSSVGADKPSKTGPVAGLYELEQKLNSLSGVNVLHLRPAYFMENTLAQDSIIREIGMAAGPLRADLQLPMIATRDIAAAAAAALLQLGFAGKSTRELLGPRDYTYAEVAAIIGDAIGKPGLQYTHVANDQLRPAMTHMGMSSNVVDLLLEMSESLNSGYMKNLEARAPRNTTPTTYEQFAAEKFVPVYRRQTTAA